MGFFVEVESNLEKNETGIERAFLTLNNVWHADLSHLQAGKIDPSAYSSYATLRQQFELVGGYSVDNESFMLPTINRIGLPSAAFASKFYGLFDRNWNAILPRTPSLFHAIAEMGIDIHGRSFGGLVPLQNWHSQRSRRTRRSFKHHFGKVRKGLQTNGLFLGQHML